VDFVKSPAECVECGAATGPIVDDNDDYAGWLCEECYTRLQKEEEKGACE